MEMAFGRPGVTGLWRVGQDETEDSDLWWVGVVDVCRLSGLANVAVLGDVVEGISGESPRVLVDCAMTSGESGGVGSFRTKVGAASSSK